MTKLLILIFALITLAFFIVQGLIKAVAKFLGSSKPGAQTNHSMSRGGEVIYRKGEVVVMKGEAGNSKSENA